MNLLHACPCPRRGPVLLIVGTAAPAHREPADEFSPATSSHPGDLKVLCSFLPVYVFAQNVVGDTPGVEVELLLSPDLGCPHDMPFVPAIWSASTEPT
jgi:ABC-type Zn uptake system ZnuABC Zn-binding protein ZnuA